MVDGVHRYTSPVEFHYQEKSVIPFGQIDAGDLQTGSYRISYDARFLDPWVGFRAGVIWDNGGGQQNWDVQSMEYSDHRFEALLVGGDLSGSTGIGAGGVPVYLNQWYHMDILIDSGYVSISMDGVLILEGSVELYDMDNIGFGVWRANAEFDNILIVRLSWPHDGDVNGDGQVDVRDLLRAMQILNGQYIPSQEEQDRWDVAPLVNGVPEPDGLNTLGDYLILQRKILGVINF